MKTIGLIGGMSWESSAFYYKIINTKVRKILGGFHSAKSILNTVDFDIIQKYQFDENWTELDKLMVQSAKQLEAAGADFIVLCTNTMHLCSPAIIKNISIPFLHIAEATGAKIADKGFKKVALLGTRFTMEKDFYKSFISERFGIEVIIPGKAERELINDTIYKELVHGQIKNESRENFKKIIANLEENGAEGVILGCTEIPLLISGSDVNIPVFDTTTIHAEKAVEWALMDHKSFIN
jgi:aspartate racemase